MDQERGGGGPTANVHEHASGLDLDAPVVWDGSPLALLDVGAGGLVEEINHCLEWGVRASGWRERGGGEGGGRREEAYVVGNAFAGM